jgi:hypothetical protein
VGGASRRNGKWKISQRSITLSTKGKGDIREDLGRDGAGTGSRLNLDRR